MSAQELLSQRVRPHGPCRISPGTPLGYAELRTRGRIDRARGRVIESPSDLGASVVEWVIISALVVGIAGAISVVLLDKLRTKANTVLDTPAAP